MKKARQQCYLFQFSEVMYDDVCSLLVNWDPKMAAGCDIPCKPLKLGTFPLLGTWCKLINSSKAECKVRDILKFAEISAQYKNIYIMRCKENYRPGSVLAALSKVFENVRCVQMTSYSSDWLFTTVSIFQTSIIALLCGCSPVSPRWTNLKKFRTVR